MRRFAPALFSLAMVWPLLVLEAFGAEREILRGAEAIETPLREPASCDRMVARLEAGASGDIARSRAARERRA